MRKISFFLFSSSMLLFLSLTEPLMAAAYPKTSSDFALIPGYCKARFGSEYSVEYRKWHNVFGKGWGDMHHYCKGLLYIQKGKLAIAASKKQKDSYLEAIKQFNYVQERWPQGYMLLPELIVKRGEAMAGLGKNAQALNEFRTAIKIKPDYSAPYIALSEYYIGIGNRTQAEHWLQEGIKNAPKSKKLKRKLLKLEKEEN